MRSTLLLNATFEPLAVVSLRRAVVLVLAQKAEVVECDDVVLRSARESLRLPRVIRLVRYVAVPYRRRVAFTRRGVLERDRHTCAYCGGRATTIDHVVPRSRGGVDSWRNCVASCTRCNGRKGSRLLGREWCPPEWCAAASPGDGRGVGP